ncbi:MAG TPA: hypothetical protein VJ718_04400, partial [Candidatus Binataceae bacterium]|nr:hypothetical protein [Candidatus Binataceae bacterium]
MGADDKAGSVAAGRNSAAAARQYAPYLEAHWGFKNAWYPALFSAELPDDAVKVVTIADHEIALRRAGG